LRTIEKLTENSSKIEGIERIEKDRKGLICLISFFNLISLDWRNWGNWSSDFVSRFTAKRVFDLFWGSLL